MSSPNAASSLSLDELTIAIQRYSNDSVTQSVFAEFNDRIYAINRVSVNDPVGHIYIELGESQAAP